MWWGSPARAELMDLVVLANQVYESNDVIVMARGRQGFEPRLSLLRLAISSTIASIPAIHSR